MKKISYYLLFGFAWLVSQIPFWIIYRISDFIYLIIFYLAGYRRKVVFKNLRNSFPGKTDQEIKSIAKGFYHHFCDFWLETIKGMTMSPKTLDTRFNIKNIKVIDELAKKNRSFAMVMAHYNNWEWMLHFPAFMKAFNVMIIYKPLNNKNVDRLTKYLRARLGVTMVPMDGIYKTALKYKAENKLISVGYLADQRPPRTNIFWTKFLNQEASFYQGTEKISRKLEMAVVFVNVNKVKRGYYEVIFKKLFDNAKETKENEVTLACVKEIEEQIQRKPDYWLWSHKRFKHKKPDEIKLISE